MTRCKATECESLVTSPWPRTRLLLCASTRSRFAAALCLGALFRLCVYVPILVNDLFFFIKIPTHYYQIHYYRYRYTIQLTPGIQAWKQTLHRCTGNVPHPESRRGNNHQFVCRCILFVCVSLLRGSITGLVPVPALLEARVSECLGVLQNFYWK